jgi:hypothetical protein
MPTARPAGRRSASRPDRGPRCRAPEKPGAAPPGPGAWQRPSAPPPALAAAPSISTRPITGKPRRTIGRPRKPESAGRERRTAAGRASAATTASQGVSAISCPVSSKRGRGRGEGVATQALTFNPITAAAEPGGGCTPKQAQNACLLGRPEVMFVRPRVQHIAGCGPSPPETQTAVVPVNRRSIASTLSMSVCKKLAPTLERMDDKHFARSPPISRWQTMVGSIQSARIEMARISAATCLRQCSARACEAARSLAPEWAA